jgi:hypothetical protein
LSVPSLSSMFIYCDHSSSGPYCLSPPQTAQGSVLHKVQTHRPLQHLTVGQVSSFKHEQHRVCQIAKYCKLPAAVVAALCTCSQGAYHAHALRGLNISCAWPLGATGAVPQGR